MTRAVAAALALVSLCGARASANPFYIGRYGGLRADPMYTGAFAFYWNPAALARPGWDVAVDGMLVARQASFNRDAAANGVSPADAPYNAGLAKPQSASALPTIAGRIGFVLGPIDLGVGAAAFVDIAGSSRVDGTAAAPAGDPGAVDGPQRWASISSNLTVISLAASFALRHRASGLSFGVTPILDLASFSTTRAIDLDGTDQLVDSAGRLKEGRAYFDASGIAGRFILGARWDYRAPDGRERYGVGLTYRRGTTYNLDGTLRAVFGTSAETQTRAHLSLPIADVLDLGAALRIHRRLRLRPSVEWALWRILKEHLFVSDTDGTVLLRFARNWHDSVAGRVRADVLVHERVELQLGLGFEYGATPSSTQEPGLGENDNLEAGVGALAALSHRVDLSVDVILQYFLPRTVTNSIQRPTENGRYTDQREFVSLHLEVHGWRPFPASR